MERQKEKKRKKKEEEEEVGRDKMVEVYSLLRNVSVKQ